MRCIAPANCLFVPLILLGLVFIYYFTNKYQQFGNFIIFLSSVLRFTANILCSCNLCICRFRRKGESLHCVICLALSNVINVLGPFVVESHVILSTCTKNLESKKPEFKKKNPAFIHLRSWQFVYVFISCFTSGSLRKVAGRGCGYGWRDRVVELHTAKGCLCGHWYEYQEWA